MLNISDQRDTDIVNLGYNRILIGTYTLYLRVSF